MKRVIVVVFFIVFFMLPVSSKMITGQVRYSTEGVREEVLASRPMTYDREKIKLHIVDSNRVENITSLLKGVTDLKDRTLAYFSDGSYGVVYKENPLNVFYYGSDGILTHEEIRDSKDYPYRSYKYSVTGRLVNMGMRISKEETYIFEPKGGLIAHWVGSYCYDEEGNIIMSRKILK